MPSINKLIDLSIRKMSSDEDSLKEVNKYLDQALLLDRNNIEALYYKGVACKFAGNFDEAINYAEKMLKIKNSSLLALYLKASSLTQLKLESKANILYKQIIETPQESDGDSMYYCMLGASYKRLEDIVNAKTYYLKSIERNGNNPFSLCNLANIFMAEKDYQSALPLLEKAVVIWSGQSTVYLELAKCYKETGEFQKAIKYYETNKSIVGDKDFIDYDDLANCYHEVKDFEKAGQYYNAYLHKNPGDVLVWINSAHLCLDVVEKEKENNNNEDALDFENLALQMLDTAYKTYNSRDYDRKALTDEEKKSIKHAFAVREELRSELEEINSTKIAYKEEVSYSIKHNKAWEEEEYKLTQIKTNPKLKNYYDSFKQFADSYVISAFVENAGRVQGKLSGITEVVDLVKDSVTIIPCASLFISAVNKAIDIAYGIKQDNQAKNILLNLKHFEDAQKLIKHIAIEVTLNKRFQIQNVEDQKGKFLSAILKVKDKAMVNLKSEPEKALAYKDACILITLCQKGIVNTDACTNIEDSLMSSIMEYEVKMEYTPLIKKTINAIDEKTACIVMAVPEVHYDNWVLNMPNVLTDAYKEGGMDLVNTWIAIGEYNSIDTLGLHAPCNE
jgi:tetratricopeptide (TPR) repeat protein